jgi:imidazole glycerol-phosphate synthase subunit HisH
MIAVINYGMGNLGSIVNMLKKIGAESCVTADPVRLEQADKLILPGVGAFARGMKNLDDMGLRAVLDDLVIRRKKPILGICLGMQLFSEHSEEGNAKGLGWIKATTQKFRFDFETSRSNLRIPHMGWNGITIVQNSPFFASFHDEPRFYFVHSYHIVCCDIANVLARTQYGYEFVSSVMKDNIIGVQFHPEKSHKFGMQFLRNFVEAE